MANKIVKFISETFGSVRGLYRDGQPWLVVKDVCKCLGLKNVGQAVSRLEADELTSFKMMSGGQHREMFFVNEPGMYRLVFSSRKPEARDFQNWVFKDVLPQLRREGEYQMAWACARAEGKEVRLTLTDTIKIFCEYLDKRGELDRPLGTWIIIFTRLINRTFGIENGRDELTEEQLDTVNLWERIIARTLEHGMAEGKGHHDIWLACNEKLNAWQQLVK